MLYLYGSNGPLVRKHVDGKLRRRFSVYFRSSVESTELICTTWPFSNAFVLVLEIEKWQSFVLRERPSHRILTDFEPGCSKRWFQSWQAAMY